MSKTAKMVSEIKYGDVLVIGSVSFTVNTNAVLTGNKNMLILTLVPGQNEPGFILTLPDWVPLEVETP